ncbi:response regulator transcription factor [Streptomyces sp. WM6386]|uniref:response regulator transcription factor n=1 Tax=Streptomyces sp. WM6386 TaxID=1415558 RepID=UPI000619D230|nr:helix-turn-helix transcriptional regulator [Streptomyces sp. WM6386]KKD03481.1 hypothetical protein TN53_34975 [Streptomyces sp. WM6386]
MTKFTSLSRKLEEAADSVIKHYFEALLANHSPLAADENAWKQCRRQATAILQECAKHLRGEGPTNAEKEAEYSKLLGSYRALQGIPATESVIASEILWSCLTTVLDSLVAQEDDATGEAVRGAVEFIFRKSVGLRLHKGVMGYIEVHGRQGDGTPVAPVRTLLPGPLTPREQQVLEGVAHALSNRQIGRELGIREATVKRHMHNIFEKLGARSRLEAVQKMYRSPAPPLRPTSSGPGRVRLGRGG